MEFEFAGHFTSLQFPRAKLTSEILDIISKNDFVVEKYFNSSYINFVSKTNICDLLSYTYNCNYPAKIANELIANLESAKILFYPGKESCLLIYVENRVLRYFDQEFDRNKYKFKSEGMYYSYEDIPRPIIYIN